MKGSLPGTRAFASKTRQTTAPGLPRVTRIYRNHHLDSTRWEVYEPREGDIVVATSYKSGTTWMEQILGLLVDTESRDSFALHGAAPWIDGRLGGQSMENLRRLVAGMPGRRLIKTHLPLDGLPFYPSVRYIVVGRDPRDVFMSLFNQYRNYTDLAFTILNDQPGLVGETFPKCPEDPQLFWRSWMTRGFFEWESEGWPFWANLGHTQSFWNYRHLPNLLFVHYADMLADLSTVARRVAAFLGIDASEPDIRRVTETTAFDHVKKRAEAAPPASDHLRPMIEGGLRTFFHKGTNGRWRNVLHADDLALYEATKARVLSPDCARWLENGGAIGQPRGGGFWV